MKHIHHQIHQQYHHQYHQTATPSNIPTISTSNPSIEPTKNSTELNDICVAGDDVNEYGIELSKVSDDPILYVGIKINCKNKKVLIKLKGPSNYWFGIVFGTEMMSFNGNQAIIYTTGKNGTDIPSCSDYFINR